MSYAHNYKTLHIEILTPKQNSDTLDADLEKFAVKYQTVLDSGYVASITDNPMGNLSFQATEMIAELDLPVATEKLLIHLNTFHTKEHLDTILTSAIDMGARYLLAVSGDGSERLPKLKPEAIGFNGEAVTAVELLQYIHREYPGKFVTGVAFNPYEPQDHELEKMRHKIDAGASFIITQPVIGKDERLDPLETFGIPVIVDAWMSKKIHLLSECIGYEIPEDTPYDPIENLKELRRNYPDHGLYLALVGYKTQLPRLPELLG
ncbi:MAG: methylenetetrahydrofolate reductase [Lentisphaerae bacterium]|nr:methylenetetrahydrofolate reductase [Lentisphaerota bacterium]